MTGKGARAKARMDALSFQCSSSESREETSKTVVQPNKFFGEPGEDIEKWLKSFERVSKANNWSEMRQKDVLPAFLRERAAEFYDELPSDIDLEELKTALIKQFSPSEARRLYYSDLYERKQGQTESAADFGRDVQQLVRRAYSGMPVEHQDTLMREHFVNGLRPEIKRIVLIADPETFNKALQIARREEINEQLTNGTAPWAQRADNGNKPMPVSTIGGEQQRMNERLERLVAAVEKLAVSMEKSQPPRQRYRGNNSNTSRNLRCTDGRPICNFCQRVGHVEARCQEKRQVREPSKN